MSLHDDSLTGAQPAVSRGRQSEPRRKHILCYVTDRRALAVKPSGSVQESLLNTIEAAAVAGVDWIQLREKDLSGKDCTALTREALQRVAKLSQARASGICSTRILVNDRLDVALAERAGGVHLGENSLPVSEVKRLLSVSPAARSLLGDFLVGVSCHSLESAKSAAAAGADYIFFGPVFSTPSKAAFGAPQGLDRLAEVCRSVSIPVLAIGGITLANAAACFATGAAGLAAIRLFQASENLTLVVKALRDLGF